MDLPEIWLREGFRHLLDPSGVDHILFIVSFSAIFLLEDWKRIVGAVTAFTMGHTVTLGLATYRIISIDSNVVERLIPITIIVTCVFNIYAALKKRKQHREVYVIGALFGLIHGLGFSNYIRAMLMPGESFWKSLLFFNIGLEIGQIVVVAATLLLSYLVVEVLKVSRWYYTIFVCLAVTVWTIKLMV